MKKSYLSIVLLSMALAITGYGGSDDNDSDNEQNSGENNNGTDNGSTTTSN